MNQKTEANSYLKAATRSNIVGAAAMTGVLGFIVSLITVVAGGIIWGIGLALLCLSMHRDIKSGSDFRISNLMVKSLLLVLLIVLAVLRFTLFAEMLSYSS
ncbi:hypothetical protein JW930_06025 [Candidatus Woesearchaeota archaeon]|nr:hypothetical protein [Candidatus Woesearchaeota archaeon]